MIHLEDRLFSVEIRFCFSFFAKKNAKSVFQNFNLDLPIESTQNFRAVFSIFHKYSHLFWTLLSRNKIIFIKPTAFRLFDHLIKAILGSKFLQNWLIHVQPTCSRTWRGQGTATPKLIREFFSLTVTLEIVKRKQWPLFSLETFKLFL